MIENDVGGGYGARGEFYPEDFLIPFAARHVKRPVKWIEDRRENLMAMNHAREEECDLEVACARDGTILAIRGEVHTDMGAYMRTNGAVGARNVCAVHGRAVPRAARQDRLVALDDQQDAGRHLSRAGPLRGQLLPRAHDRHDRRRSRHRPHRVPPQEPDHEQRAALSDRPCAADRRQGRIRQRRIFRDARPRAEGDRLAEDVQAPGQADRRQVSRPRRGLLRRGRRRRPEGNRRGSRSTRTAPSRSTWARRRSGRASRRCSRRSPPTRSKCRSSASITSITARPPM